MNVTAATSERESAVQKSAGTAAALLLLTLAVGIPWTILFAYFPPRGQNFPRWDDWAFMRGAFDFAAGKGIHYFGCASMPELGQWVWAWPFIRCLGPEPWVLRVSTLVILWIGAIAFFDLLRVDMGVSVSGALLAAAALVLNPIVFWLSGTFMTDVPALTFSLVALAAYARVLRSGHMAWLFPGTIAAVLAVSTRQNAVAAPLALAWVMYHRRQPANGVAWIAGVLVPLATAISVAWWFHGRPDANNIQLQIPGMQVILFTAFTVLHTLGLSALPLVPCRWPGRNWLGFTLILAVMTAGAIASYRAYSDEAGNGLIFPYTETLLPEGFWVLGAPQPFFIGRTTGVVLSGLGCVGAAVLVSAAWCYRLRGDGSSWAGLLVPFTALHWLSLFFGKMQLMDRYVVPLLPGALALLVANGCRGWRYRMSGIAVALMAFVCVLTTHDWFAWDSARWQLGERALGMGIKATDIEGGFEWDAWHSPPAGMVRIAQGQDIAVRPPGLALPFDAQAFPDLTGRYALSLSLDPRARVIAREPYRCWLKARERHVYLLDSARPPRQPLEH